MSAGPTLLETIEASGARTLDLRVTDLAGIWRSVAIEAGALDEAALERGLLIDGSAIAGWRGVEDSDLRLVADPSAFALDPFSAQPSVIAIAQAIDPVTGDAYDRDPRATVGRALAALERSGRADGARAGVGLGLHLLEPGSHEAVQASEGAPPRAAFAAFPADRNADLRAEIAATAAELGAPGLTHAKGEGPDQADVRLPAAAIEELGDRVQFLRFAAHGVAAAYGKRASFLAKPSVAAPSSLMRLELALDRAGEPVFAGAGYANLSDLCMYFMGGVLAHSAALSAFLRPNTNAYRAQRRPDDAPCWQGYAAFNRSAAIRIPFAERREDKRIELRFADPTANPYLAAAATLMAGLDGIERKVDPGDALDRNLYDLGPEQADAPRLPRDLGAALAALERDRAFLVRDEVFADTLIDAYLDLKRHEATLVEAVPHPAEIAYWGAFF